MTKKQVFDALARKNGIHCGDIGFNRIETIYTLPRKHPSHLRSIHVYGPKRVYDEKEEKGCVLSYRCIDSRSRLRKIRFYLNTIEEAYALLFAIVFMPEKIRYEFHHRNKRTVIKRELFNTLGERTIFEALRLLPALAPIWVEGILTIFLTVIRFLLLPFLSLRDMMFRKWEFLFEKDGDEFVIIGRNCFGPFNKRTARRAWMIINGE